jgi:23S rRNA pseudouridine1911/1915/1917 synthase
MDQSSSVWIRHPVALDAAPERLDRYLTRIFTNRSRSQIQRWIAQGRVRSADMPLKASHRIKPGEILEIAVPPIPTEPSSILPEPIPLSIIYEDEHILVVDKPAGMVVHPAPGHPTGTLVNALLSYVNRLSQVAGPLKPGIVHRLDKETSGLLVVAKDDTSHRALARQFAERLVLRQYLAVVKGQVASDEGTIQIPIGRHPIHRQRMSVRWEGGRDACTRYRVLRRFLQASLLELSLHTGRTHQVRVHLAALGHPLLGDRRYGVHGGCPRQALHAHRLGFIHPATDRWMVFHAPLPPDLDQFIRTL